MLNGLQVAPNREHKDNCALSETIRFSGRHILLGNAIFEDARASHAPPDFRVIIIREETAPRLHPPRSTVPSRAWKKHPSSAYIKYFFLSFRPLIAGRLRGEVSRTLKLRRNVKRDRKENGFERAIANYLLGYEGSFLISKDTSAAKRHKLRCFRANRMLSGSTPLESSARNPRAGMFAKEFAPRRIEMAE